MVPYFLGIPLALAATGLFARFLEQGGAINWLLGRVLLSLAFLVHLTTAMVAVAGGCASASMSRRCAGQATESRSHDSRHVQAISAARSRRRLDDSR